MNLATFRIQFPEFQNAPNTFVQVFLDASALEINTDIWGDMADQGQGYLAAHKMALSPWGQAARLSNANGSSTYQDHYDRLVGIVGGGGMLV